MFFLSFVVALKNIHLFVTISSYSSEFEILSYKMLYNISVKTLHL